MSRTCILFPVLAAALLLASPAHAEDAMMRACTASPSDLPAQKCQCFSHELRKVLSADEMRIEILSFQGKFNELRRKIADMGTEKGDDFTRRVASVVKGPVCNR